MPELEDIEGADDIASRNPVARTDRAMKYPAHFRAVALILLFGWACAPFADWVWPTPNLLRHYPDWLATKTIREQPVGLAHAYVANPQALAGKALHFHPWHGYQELVYQRDLPIPCTVAFHLKLGEGGWFALGYNHDLAGFDGFRLAADSLETSFIAVREDGRFVETIAHPGPPLEAGRWHRVRLELEAEGATLWVNDQVAAVTQTHPTATSRLSFRGGLHPASIDRLTIRDETGARWLVENFDRYPLQWAKRVLLGLGASVIAAGALLLYALARQVTLSPHAFRRSLAALALSASVTWIGVLAINPYRESLYPVLDRQQPERAEAFLKRMEKEVHDEIRARFTTEKGSAQFRMLLLGSSQLWGAGALYREERVAEVLQGKLHTARVDGRSIEIINAAVPGSNAARLFVNYLEVLEAYQPDLAVLNLGMNDLHNPDFYEDLSAFVRYLLDAGVEVLLTTEPITLEWMLALPTHAVLLEVAREWGVSGYDLHGHLATHHESGFLWLDFVHATSYGQRLMAAYLATEICALLNCSWTEGAVNASAFIVKP